MHSGLQQESHISYEMMASSTSQECEKSSIPLYELRPGISLTSNALGCAIKCGTVKECLYVQPITLYHSGIPDEIVKRAEQVMQCQARNECIPRIQHDQLQGRGWEEQLLKFVSSVKDWKEATNDQLAKFRTMLCIGEQWCTHDC